jgi:urate oxidase
VRILLEGDIETSYTKADNSVVVATDSMKNTVFLLAKLNEISPPELFAATIANHFVSTYQHITGAQCTIIQSKWTRIPVRGNPHKHSFYRDGEDVRTAFVHYTRANGFDITGGIAKLLILKSTGSAFYGFLRDKYTTLPETWDRLFSTEVECKYVYKKLNTLEQVKDQSGTFESTFTNVRETTLNVFAEDDSASVQATMYLMSNQILKACTSLKNISYVLPNKHYFQIPMDYINVKNTGKDASVYRPEAYPAGNQFIIN